MRTLLHSWFLVALVGGLTVSLTFPETVLPAIGWIRPQFVIAAALFLMAWTMPSRSLWDEARRPGAALWGVALSYGVCPLLAWGMAGGIETDMRVGILICGSVPCTLASAVLWTRLAGGNEATALLVTLTTTFTGWFFTPGWLWLTTGALVELPIERMMIDLLATLVLPVSLGQLAQAVPTLALAAQRRKAFWSILSQTFILTIIFQGAGRLGERLQLGEIAIGFDAAFTVAVTLGLHLSVLGLGWLSSGIAGFDAARRSAVAIAGSQKTLPVSFLLYETYFQRDFPLAIVPVLAYHVGQLLLDSPIALWLRPCVSEAEDVESAGGN